MWGGREQMKGKGGRDGDTLNRSVQVGSAGGC